MRRARRIRQFWNWLPAFRAVAETNHLPTASEWLRVAPSALSRTIRLLEDEVGATLFERVGRRLELTHAGRRMLVATRDAMRQLDDVLEELDEGIAGPIQVAAPSSFVPLLVLPALRSVARKHPHLEGHVSSAHVPEASTLLQTGELDLALAETPPPDEELSVELLARVEHGLYVAPEHPLADGAGSLGDEPLEWPFVAPPRDERGLTPDAWPEHRSRRVALRVEGVLPAVEAVRTGMHLAVLPEALGHWHGLRRVEGPELEESRLYLLERPRLGTEGRIETVADALRRTAELEFSHRTGSARTPR